MRNLELGAIGNGTIAAMVDEDATISWLCLPRLDGEPIFNALLNGDGAFKVVLHGQKTATHRYIRNTGVLETTLTAEDGSAILVTDFAPRFKDRGRMFRPTSVVRRITPLQGMPTITISICAQQGSGAQRLVPIRGVSHLSYHADAMNFRITTDAPLSYITDSREFVLDREINFILGPDESLSDSPLLLARDWQERTVDHWTDWSRRLGTPAEWQEAVIRAAITLKMCVYEETGGIVAALTTSIPEHADSGRNWDYRFCWLRDAFFTVWALNRLSDVETLEKYLSYLINIVAHTKGGHIQPVYGVALEPDLTEATAPALPGYRDMGPVRIGNQAAEHIQHDVYGQVVLGAAQAFFDERLEKVAGPIEFEHFEVVGERAFQLYNTPDAGIWEYRGRAVVHTSSAIMCWAACDRLAKIAERVGRTERIAYWGDRARTIKETILTQAWSDQYQSFMGSFGGDALDASVLLMVEIGFLPADDPRFIATVDAISKNLREGCHVFRYRQADDFGTPRTAFSACSFWLVDALARIGRKDEARAMFEELLSYRTKLGLYSEDIDTQTGELWGNIPQTYCMVGVINAAARLSTSWDCIV